MLARHLEREDLLWCAPQARHGSWYPQRFMAPLEDNEPALSSALEVVSGLAASLDQEGIPAQRRAILGFSQGACLALEQAVRQPRSFAAVIALAGGLIGPPGTLWPNSGSLAGTPILLACGDADPHIPVARVEESARVLTARGADVEMHLEPGFGHGVLPHHLTRVRTLLDEVLKP